MSEVSLQDFARKYNALVEENARLQAELERLHKYENGVPPIYPPEKAKLEAQLDAANLALAGAREIAECSLAHYQEQRLGYEWPREITLARQNACARFLDTLPTPAKDTSETAEAPDLTRIAACVKKAVAWFGNCQKKWEVPPTEWRDFPMRGVTQYREPSETSVEFDLFEAVEALTPEDHAWVNANTKEK